MSDPRERDAQAGLNWAASIMDAAIDRGATITEARERAAAWCIAEAEHCEHAARRHRERAALIRHGELDPEIETRPRAVRRRRH